MDSAVDTRLTNSSRVTRGIKDCFASAWMLVTATSHRVTHLGLPLPDVPRDVKSLCLDPSTVTSPRWC